MRRIISLYTLSTRFYEESYRSYGTADLDILQLRAVSFIRSFCLSMEEDTHSNSHYNYE